MLSLFCRVYTFFLPFSITLLKRKAARNMNVITGVCGFIGSNLALKLLQTGAAVTGVDKSSDEHVLNKLREFPCFKFIRCDISGPVEGKLADELKKAHNVYHLAAFKTNKAGLKTFYQDNILATRRLLSIEYHNLKNFFFTSSLYVYGSNFGVARETDTVMPDNAYGLSKLICEDLIAERFSGTSVNHILARLFFVYGKPLGESSGYKSVILKFLNLARASRPLEIYGSGEQTLDYIHIFDVINALNELQRKKYKGIVNIGSGQSTSVNSIFDLVDEISGLDLDKTFHSPDKTDGTHRVSCNDKLGLYYKPQISLSDGLKNLWRQN